MTYLGRQNKNGGRIRFLQFGVLILLIWIVAASLVDRSPVTLFSDSLKYASGSGENQWKRLSQYRQEIRDKDSIIAELRSALEDPGKNGGFQQAMVKVESDNLNMREKPAISAGVLIKLPVGSVVEILYYDQETYRIGGEYGKWCKVRYAGKEGWVWGNYLEIID